MQRTGSHVTFRRSVVQVAVAVALVFGFSAQVSAQGRLPSEAPVPEKMPFDIPYGPSIDLAKAQDLIAAAAAEAKAHDWKMAIAVVDSGGDLVAFAKMDGTQVASVTIAQNKAWTAARFRRPTSVFYDAAETGHPSVMSLDPKLVASPGGFPLLADGKLIGAIGCSGGAGVQDAAACKAALAKLH